MKETTETFDLVVIDFTDEPLKGLGQPRVDQGNGVSWCSDSLRSPVPSLKLTASLHLKIGGWKTSY